MIDALHWLPELSDPESALAEIRATSGVQNKLAKIIDVAGHRLDFVQTGKLDRYLEQVLAELPEPSGLQPVRVAWLGSSTLEHLLPSARIAGLRRSMLVESYLAPYGQYRQELLDPGSGLTRFKPHVVVIALDHEAISLGSPLDAHAADVDARVHHSISELRGLWARASEGLRAVVIQQSIPNLAPRLFGSFDGIVAGSPASAIDRWNRAMIDAAAAARVAVLDLAACSAQLGHNFWFDPVRWLHAKQLVAPAATPLYGDLVARIVGAIRGRSRKCLVLDLDNTLWGGVVGDDGVERLVLGHGSPSGEAFASFQHHARKLKERGIVLAVCSKNESEIARSAFVQHPEMVLRLDDIAMFVANWDDKATNLKRIAEGLNIGLDALVFFDDNPAERALVRGELPAVAVPEVPEDPAYFIRTLDDSGYFEAISFTGDDLARAQQYKDNGRRIEAFESATDMDSFLKGLAMSLKIGRVDAQNLPRVTQLINKTNQFNVTTRRYTEAEVRAFAEDERNVTMHFRLIDRFGDNGLISVLLARPSSDTPHRLEIDTLLMSCRVLGRGVEQAILNALVERAARRGIRELVGEYLPTAKNAMVSELFARLGFAKLEHPDAAKGASRWLLRVEGYTRLPNFMEVFET